jgi:hypothetical protein
VFIGEDRYFALHRRAAAGLRRKIDWRERERMLKIRLDQLGGADV